MLIFLDYEFFPDYMKQPRFSVKGLLQNVKDGDTRKNVFGVTPIFSKGFSFWGYEGFRMILSHMASCSLNVAYFVPCGPILINVS